MKYLTVLQMRTSSSRLPGKAFLDFNGTCLYKLCIERAQVPFSKLIVATSNETTDDLLAFKLHKEECLVFRGELGDVLSRFVHISNEFRLASSDVIIRLTGDNPLVDKYFLSEMKQVWEQNDLDYLSAQPKNSGLINWPYGLSAEFFKVELLQKSFVEDLSSYNKEHVTPYISKNASKMGCLADFIPPFDLIERSFSVDELDDYLFVAQLFAQMDKTAHYREIIEVAKKMGSYGV